MRAVVQRVLNADVKVGAGVVAAIGRGLLVLLAVETSDTLKDVAFMSRKLLGLRIFEDPQGKMNLSVSEVEGEVLLISQFTLLGDCRKGNRPSFIRAAQPDLAESLYIQLGDEIRQGGVRVETGRFRARMEVSLVNEGPVTLILDSNRKIY
jgi:D-tyrosyl-tRNA(Tyr) deacylase